MRTRALNKVVKNFKDEMDELNLRLQLSLNMQLEATSVEEYEKERDAQIEIYEEIASLARRMEAYGSWAAKDEKEEREAHKKASEIQ